MDQNTLAVLQAIAAFLQVLVACVALPITAYIAVKSAREGARQAYELGEVSAREREAREKAKQLEQQQEQIKSLRLLLGLEIQRNFDDLEWLRTNLRSILGEEDARYYHPDESDTEDADRFSWLEARQRFIALYMPDWSHRVWYNQQSSYLLPIAFDLKEVRDINYIHSQFDRLAKIKNMLTERAHNLVASSSQAVAGNLNEVRLMSGSFKEDAPRLWHEFNDTVEELLALGNPLKVATDGGISSAASLSQASGSSSVLNDDSRSELATKLLKE